MQQVIPHSNIQNTASSLEPIIRENLVTFSRLERGGNSRQPRKIFVYLGFFAKVSVPIQPIIPWLA